MEELQDAIEDAQYVNAIATQLDGPRPLATWQRPTDEQFDVWRTKTAQRETDAFTIDWTLHSPIGFFQFAAFIKDHCKEEHVRMNFIEDLARWRLVKSASGRQKLGLAKKIIEVYFGQPQKHPETGKTVLLPVREIEEKELYRDKHINKLTKEEVAKLISMNIDQSTPQQLESQEDRIRNSSHNHLGFRGSAITDITVAISALEQKFASTLQRRNTQAPIRGVPLSIHEATESATYPSPTVDGNGPGLAKESPAESPPLTGVLNLDSPRASNDASQSTSVTFVSRDMKMRPSDKCTKNVASARGFDSINNLGIGVKETKTLSEAIPLHIFDTLDVMVVEYFRRCFWEDFLASEYNERFCHFLWLQSQPVVPDDFVTMRVLGRGGFGLVTACKKATSGKLFAMKVMNKRRIKLKKSEKLAVNERDALAAVGDCPFVVNLKYSFHHKEDVYLILDLMTGGDLGYHLGQKGKFRRKESQYYAARIMLGLQALHDKGYVFRDLKPENLLLDEEGRVKITDLGLAAQLTPSLHGAAGTRGYWAPEMLRRDKNGRRMSYGHAVDWFSFGCCIAEFVSGSNPFRSETALNFGLEKGAETKEKAIDKATLEMTPDFPPSKFDPDAADLCRRLLEKDPKIRLGASGYGDIMSHPWFNDVSWVAIKSDQKQPPFIPPKDINAASQSEIGNFIEDKAYQECVLEPKDEEVYKDWNWTNLKANDEEVLEFLVFERKHGKPLLPLDPNASCCCAIM